MKRNVWIAALGLSLLGALAWGAGDTTLPLRRLALYIGSNDGGPGRATLRYAEQDARVMAGLMQELGGVSAEDSLVLLAPTADDVQNGFRQVRRRAQTVKDGARRVEFLLYYSGHSDEQGLLLGGELFGYTQLKQAIQEVRADVNIAILDSCSSGAFTRLKGGTRQPPFLLDESSQMSGHAFISSSSADEAAQESDRINGSFFTHFLVSGLRGAADSTRDGQVSLNEAYHFAFNETLALTENTQGGPQHPSYNIQLTGTGDLTLTDLRAAACLLSIAEEVEGRLFVRDESGRLVVELAKAPNLEVGLALPEGRYRVVLDQGRKLYETSVVVRPGRAETLSMQMFSQARRQPAIPRGNVGAEEDFFPEEQGFWQRAQQWWGRDSSGSSVQPAPVAPPGATAPEALLGNPEEAPSWEAPAGNAPVAPAPREAPVAPSPAEEPAAPAGAAEPAVPAPAEEPLSEAPAEPQVTRVPFALSLLPFVSTAGPGRHEIAFSLNLLAGVSWAIRGAELGAVIDITEHEVHGLQAAGVGNILGGPLFGLQSAGVFNIVSGDTRALQSAGVFNIVQGEGSFVQSAGVFNIDDGPFEGLQAAGVFNIGTGKLAGLQAAGVFNLQEGALYGAQAAGVFNRAGSVAGAQVGLVNISGEVAGSQIGLVNVASGEVRGVQVGLVNVARRVRGVPLGLVNVITEGAVDGSAWITEDGIGYAGLQMSGGLVYTLLYVGAELQASPSVFAAGAGLGLRLPVGRLFVESDLSLQHAFVGDPAHWGEGFQTSPYSPVFPTARLLVGVKVVGPLAVFGGVMLNGSIPNATVSTPLHSGVPVNLDFTSWNLLLYPKLVLGLRL